MFGPNWVERFVRTQIEEAISVALEVAFLTGEGASKDQPVGLMKDIQENGGSLIKQHLNFNFADADTTVNELKDVLKGLSVKENGKK